MFRSTFNRRKDHTTNNGKTYAYDAIIEKLIPKVENMNMDINTLNNVWFDSVTYLKYYAKAWE